MWGQWHREWGALMKACWEGEIDVLSHCCHASCSWAAEYTCMISTKPHQTDDYSRPWLLPTSIGVNFVIKVGGSWQVQSMSLLRRSGGGNPSGFHGQSPWSVGKGAEASSWRPKAFLFFRSVNKAQICPFFLSCKLLKYFFKRILCVSVTDIRLLPWSCALLC